MTTDGAIRLGGLGLEKSGWVPIILGLRSDGTPDSTFGENGVWTAQVPPHEVMMGIPFIHLDSLGRLTAVVDVVVPFQSFRVFRLLADGSPDPSYGGGDGVSEMGYLPSRLSREPQRVGAGSFTVDRNGRLLVAGALNYGYFCHITRLTTSGSFDSSFGPHGRKAFSLTDCGSIIVTRSGRILMGAAQRGGTEQMYAFTQSGNRDQRMTKRMRWLHPPKSNDRSYWHMIELPDGRIVFAGVEYEDYNRSANLIVARMRANGTRDSSWGHGAGYAKYKVPVLGKLKFHLFYPSALILDPSGRAIVASSLSWWHPSGWQTRTVLTALPPQAAPLPRQ